MTRRLAHILVANMVLETAIPVMVILGALAGRLVAPSADLALAPVAMQILAGISLPMLLTNLMHRRGRRIGFAVGAIAMAIGGMAGGLAIQIGSFPLLCFAHFMLGAALVSINFFRFAASDAVKPSFSSTAISLVIASGLVSALLGPELYRVISHSDLPSPIPASYLMISAIGFVGLIPVITMPDIRAFDAKQAHASIAEFLSSNVMKSVLPAILVMTLVHTTMMMMMSPIPLVLKPLPNAIDHTAEIVRWHIFAMFAPGLFTGYLISHFGLLRVIFSGFVVQMVGIVLPMLSPDVAFIYVSLILSGIGWNLGFIGTTRLLTASCRGRQLYSAQGIAEVSVSIGAASFTFITGVLLARTGWNSVLATALVLNLFGTSFFITRYRYLISISTR